MSTQIDVRRRRTSSVGDILDFGIEETSSEVGWKYANEGCTLISRSAREAMSTSQEIELTRRLYVDGVAYFLRGLPGNLTAEERVRLSASLPPQLDSASRPDSPVTIDSTTPEEQTSDPIPIVRSSVIRHIVAKNTVCILLVIKFVLHWVWLLSERAYRYDRRHRISDWALLKGVIIIDCIWKRAMELANRVCAMDNGKVGQTLEEVSRYLAQEVSSGLYDGIGEAVGLQRNGMRRTAMRNSVWEHSEEDSGL